MISPGLYSFSQTNPRKWRRRLTELHDKIGALEKIGKHLGMYRDIVEVRRGIEEMDENELISIARGSSKGTSETAGSPAELAGVTVSNLAAVAALTAAPNACVQCGVERLQNVRFLWGPASISLGERYPAIV